MLLRHCPAGLAGTSIHVTAEKPRVDGCTCQPIFNVQERGWNEELGSLLKPGNHP